MKKLFELVGTIGLQGYEASKSQISEVNKQAKVAQRELNAAGKEAVGLGKALTAMTAPLIALGAGLTALVMKTGEYGEQLNKMHQATGLSTDELQKLEYVANQSGVSFETFTGSIQRLTRQMPEIQGGSGKAYEALRRLGVSVYDNNGHLKDMNILFPEIVKKLQGVQNITERNALAQQLLGRNIAELSPILGMSSAQFDNLRQKAVDMGLVMSGESLEAAHKLNNAIDELKLIFTKTAMELAAKFVPIFQDVIVPIIKDKVIPLFKAVVDQLAGMAEWFKNLSPGMQSTILYAMGITAAFGPVLIAVGKLTSLFSGLIPVIVKVIMGQMGLNAAMAANPVGAVITALALLTMAGIAIYKNWDSIATFFTHFWHGVTYLFQHGVLEVKILFEDMAIGIMTALLKVGQYIPGVAEKLRVWKYEIEQSRDANKSSLEQLEKNDKEFLKHRDEMEKLTKAIKAKTEEVKKGDATEQQVTDLKAARNKKEEEYQKKRLEDNRKFIANLEADNRKYEATRLKNNEEFVKKLRQQESKDQQEAQKINLANERALGSGTLGEKLQDLKDEHDAEIAAAIKVGADTDLIEKKYARMRVQTIKDYIAEVVDIYAGMVNRVGSIMSSFNKNEETALDNKSTKEKNANDAAVKQIETKLAADKNAVNASTMSAAQKAAAIQALDDKATADKQAQADKDQAIQDELSKEKTELKRKEAKEDKALGIFNVIISTSTAVMKGFAELGPILGAIATAATIALGAAEVAAIAAQPLPMAQGALIQPSQGGTLAQVGEAGHPELIMPMERGIDQIVKGIQRGQAGDFPTSGGSGAGSGAAPSQGPAQHYHTHLSIGNFIGDKAGLKDLERKLLPIRNSEAQRKGQMI